MNTTTFGPPPQPETSSFDVEQAFVHTLPIGVIAGLAVVWLVPEGWLSATGLLAGAALAWGGVQSATLWWLSRRTLRATDGQA